MNEPTQAQIEAAAEAMEQCMFAPHELPLDDELHAKYLDTAKAALIAAAEQTHQQRIKNEVALVERAIAHTIERCAQVAESGDDLYGIRKDVAAAIRALKEKL